MAPKPQKIELKRNKEKSFGFALKGISGDGKSIEIITNVKDSASSKGLKNDVQLIAINGINIANKNHSEVLNLIKANKKKVILKVQELSKSDQEFIDATRASRAASKASEIQSVVPEPVKEDVASVHERSTVKSEVGTQESLAPEPMPRSMPKTEGMDGSHEKSEEVEEPEPMDDSLLKVSITKGSEKFGFTIILDPYDNLFKFSVVNENSVSHIAGLQGNDELVYINNKLVENTDFEYNDVIQLLSNASDPVVFHVRRNAPEIMITQPSEVVKEEEETVSVVAAQEIVEEALNMMQEPEVEASEETVKEESLEIVHKIEVPTINLIEASSINTESRVETPVMEEEQKSIPYPSPEPINEEFTVKIKKISGQSCGFSALSCKEESLEGIQTIIYIDSVENDSPAQHAGLIIGDQIQSFGILQDLVTFVQKSEDIVELKVKRVDGFLAQVMLSNNSGVNNNYAGEAGARSEVAPSEIASNMSLPMSKMPAMSAINANNLAASEISLPMSKMTFVQQPNNKQVAFQLGTEVADQVIKSRAYHYAPSSIEGEGQTVAQIFKTKSALKKISESNGRPLMEKLIEEENDDIFKENEPKVIVEPAYQLPKNMVGKSSRIHQLLSVDDIKNIDDDDAVSLQVKKPFFSDDRSVLELNLDGEHVALPKLNKLLSAWKQRESSSGGVDFEISRGKTFTINPKANK